MDTEALERRGLFRPMPVLSAVPVDAQMCDTRGLWFFDSMPDEALHTIEDLLGLDDRCCLALVSPRVWDVVKAVDMSAAGICASVARIEWAKGLVSAPEWLREFTAPEICDAIAYAGELSVLEFAVRAGCLLGGDIGRWAASAGHINILKWLDANGCSWSEGNCSTALAHGLKFSEQVLSPWNHHCFNDAAVGGHLELVKWLHANGYPFNDGACSWAA